MSKMIPGEYILAKGDIELNEGKKVTKMKVTNKGDRPVQIGSHYHFAEVNSSVDFDRAKAEGQRLNIPAGLAVRLEPGETQDVELIPYGGARTIRGFSLRDKNNVR